VKQALLNSYPIVIIALGLATTVVWIALLCYAAWGLL
jgi:hypothetical protein